MGDSLPAKPTAGFVENVAKKNGWSLNPDTTHTNLVATGLLRNREKYGYYLCPCREAWGNLTQDRDVTCPCTYAADDIEEYGHCYCGIFVESDWPENAEVDPIPERRPLELAP